MIKHKLGDTDVEVEASPDGAEVTVGESKVQLDNNGNIVGAQAFGTHMERVEGGMKITRPDGSVMIMHDSGGVTMQNLTPKSVGIKDLTQVKSHSVDETAEGCVHRIDFVGGGYFETTYSKIGIFVSMTGNNVSQSINNENEILVGQGTAASGQVH